jgi:hypothetical protein
LKRGLLDIGTMARMEDGWVAAIADIICLRLRGWGIARGTWKADACYLSGAAPGGSEIE